MEYSNNLTNKEKLIEILEDEEQIFYYKLQDIDFTPFLEPYKIKKKYTSMLFFKEDFMLLNEQSAYNIIYDDPFIKTKEIKVEYKIYEVKYTNYEYYEKYKLLIDYRYYESCNVISGNNFSFDKEKLYFFDKKDAYRYFEDVKPSYFGG